VRVRGLLLSSDPWCGVFMDVCQTVFVVLGWVLVAVKAPTSAVEPFSTTEAD
jgi:hypothetical protein